MTINPQCKQCGNNGNKIESNGKCVLCNKAENVKKNRNLIARERYAAMRSLGLKKTPYGWE
jgi:predicted Zn-ribbon and HTH transcriptional regulator